MERWQDWVMDGMLFLVTAVVLAVGVAVTYFLIWHVVKFVCDDKRKDGNENDGRPRD